MLRGEALTGRESGRVTAVRVFRWAATTAVAIEGIFGERRLQPGASGRAGKALLSKLLGSRAGRNVADDRESLLFGGS
jgi:hypothetical protein